MSCRHGVLFTRLTLITGLLAVPVMGATADGEAKQRGVKELITFNEQFRRAILSMDNAAVLALWADNGVSLLPGMAPIVGKPAIAQFMDGVVKSMPGSKVTVQENEFHDIRIMGSWASEWAITHQVVQPPDGKPAIETYGKMLLVLHVSSMGQWRIKEEMWNSLDHPPATTKP
jgi:uncharacterized protein (TIGR02246 family)